MLFKHLSTSRLPKMILVIVTIVLTVSGCGGSESPDDTSTSGIRLVSPDDAASLLNAEPDSLTLIDVRTPDEYNSGHIEGAKLIDFYEADFAESLAGLDRDQQYVIYCRSGNRSGQTREIMADLGFTNVVDIDGGIMAWDADGHLTVVG